ncbi:MAG: chloride channel protein [Acidobacteriaceae bacterium]
MSTEGTIKPWLQIQDENPLTPAEEQAIAPGRGERLFVVLAVFIGIISGTLVVAFRVAIEWLSILLLGSAPHKGDWRLIAMPVLAGLVIAFLAQYVFTQVRGSGVNQTKAALYIFNGYISFRTMVGKFLLSALALGSGFSLGPEDPSLQIGAGVASAVSRRMGLSKEKMRLFAPVGAAAGLAAAFNAPISAILFVIEEVIGRWNAAVLGATALAAISSVVVARGFWGAEPMFRIPEVNLRDPRELLAYAVLGIVGGFFAVLFSRSLGALRPRLRALPRWTHFFQSAVAGLMVGSIGYFGFPQVMGAGYRVMDQAMHAEFTWKLLLALAILKIIATTISFSSGTPGGMFAPTLFTGAMLGAAVGSVEKILLPHLTGSIGSYALVGMGVLFAGFLRAPLTSVFMVLEVSGNYSIILPVILANTIAYLISRSLQPVPIFEVFTHQDGMELPSLEEQREEEVLHIEDAMRHASLAEVVIVDGGDPLAQVLEAASADTVKVILVECSDDHWYAMTRNKLETLSATASQDAMKFTPIESLLDTARTPHLFPDMQLDNALGYFDVWPMLPVSNRASKGAIEGVLTLDSILQRYRQRS